MRFTVRSITPVIRTAFWTLWLLTIFFTACAFALASSGAWRFLNYNPRLHMYGEVYMAEFLGTTCAQGLIIFSVALLFTKSRALCWFALVPFVFWLSYQAWPRF